MIPKIINYCWFGKNPQSDFVKRCIDSWKEQCPNYEFIEWNEDNFDINSNQYVKEAYMARKWAFVSDYVRLYALKTMGGIYLDTDVELIKNLDPFLIYPAFTGYESKNYIPTAVMGSEPDNEWIRFLLSYYDNNHFINDDGTMNMQTNVITITEMTKSKYSIPFDNNKFEIENVLTIFPKDYFAPKSPGERHYRITNNTVGIHHFDGSWMEGSKKINHIKLKCSPILRIIRNFIVALIGEKRFTKIRKRG